MEEKRENQLKYAQQHLANERTYLAWIRTAVAIIGIGFLTTSLHFSVNHGNDHTGDFVATVLGISTGCFGISTIIIATVGYMKKKKQIENQVFYSHHIPILFVSFFLILIALFSMFYFTVN